MASMGRGVKDRGIDQGRKAGSRNVSGAAGYQKTQGDGTHYNGGGSKSRIGGSAGSAMPKGSGRVTKYKGGDSC